MAWWVRHWTSTQDVVGLIPAQVRLHSNTLNQGMNPLLLPYRTERGSIVHKMCSTWKFFFEGSMEFFHWEGM